MAAVLAVASVLFVAACSDAEQGTPSAGDETTETTRTTSDESSEPESTSSESGADRPKDLDMAAADPCQLMAAVPLESLGLTPGQTPLAEESDSFPGSPSCFANGGQIHLGLRLATVADEGAADFVESLVYEPTETTVKGFRVFLLAPEGKDVCMGVIDVSDGQLLDINYSSTTLSEAPPIPQATMCERIPTIAEAVLTALGV